MLPTPSLVFFLSDRRIIAYDLLQHQYFEVDTESFEALKELSSANLNSDCEGWKKFHEIGISDLFINVPWGGDPLSHVTHQASRIQSYNTEFLSQEQFVKQYTQVSSRANDIPVKEYPTSGKIITLPLPSLKSLSNVSLAECFQNRKTSRNFVDLPIKIDQLSDILFSCFAPIHGHKRDEFTELGLKDLGYRRSSPSSTGLASCEAVVWSNNIDGLEKGLYAYDEENHRLIKHDQLITSQELIYSMLDQFWIENLSAGIFIVNDLRRTWIKDIQSRGYLASHQEAGHLSQNILLCATALKLNTWLSGSFRDDFLQDKLSLKNYRFVSLFVGLGHGNNQAVSSDYLEILDRI